MAKKKGNNYIIDTENNIAKIEITRRNKESIWALIDLEDLERVINSGEPYSIQHLKIDGNHLKNMGYKGEEIGRILEHLRKVVIAEPRKNTLSELLKEIP